MDAGAGRGAAPSAGDGPRGEQRFGAFIGDGVATRTMDGLTGGAFLIGLALAVGAQDWHVGLLGAIPFLAQLLHMPVVLLLQRYPDRRTICIVASGVSRSLLLLMGLLPLLLGAAAGIEAMLLLFVLLSVAGSFGGAAMNAWLIDILPRGRMGQVLSRRLVAQGVTGTLVALLAGLMLDLLQASHGPGAGFAALYALGAGAGFVGLVFLSRIPHPPPARPKVPQGAARMLARPFRDANYRKLLAFNAAWGFAVNLAAPFITVFMLARLGLPFALLGAFTALATLASVVSLPAWGRLSDAHGNKPVLAVCAPVFSLSLLLWVLAVRDSTLMTVAVVGLIHALNGFAAAGLDLASNNIALKLSPEGETASYLAAGSMARAAASALGPIAGAGLAAWLQPRSLRFDITWSAPAGDVVLTPFRLTHYDFLFVLAALLGLYAMHRLALVREEGEAPPEQVWRALRSEVAYAGTMMGMRRFANVGIAAAHFARTLRAAPAAPAKAAERPPDHEQTQGKA